MIIVLLLVTVAGAIGWGLYLGERKFGQTLNETLTSERQQYCTQFERLVDSMARLVELLPHAMSPWLKAAEGGASMKRRESAEGRTAYLASPEARDALRKRLKEQHPEMTDADLTDAIQQVNAQVMGVKIGI